jgi:hypothetical protein
VVLEAVRQDGRALAYAGEALRNNPVVVLAAVSRYITYHIPGMVSRYITSHIPGVRALEHASDALTQTIESVQGAKTTWRFLSGIGKFVMLVLGILYGCIAVALGIWFGVHEGSSSPAGRIFGSILMVALGVFIILGAIKFPRALALILCFSFVYGSRGNPDEL